MNILTRGLKVRVPDTQYDGGNIPFEDVYWDDDTSQWKRVSDDAVCTWDGTSYVTQYTSNPAYCMRDFLTNTRYGVGDFVDSTDLDDTSINNTAKKQWQLLDGEHRNELNLVIEGPSDPYSILKVMARAGRMIVYWSAGYIKFKYEEDEDPVQLFTMGNIVENSFQIAYLPHSEMPNIIEAQFADKDEDYRMSMREVVDEACWALNKPKRRQTVSFKGISNENQLLREAKYALNSALYKTKMLSFKAPMDAVHCEPGDIVNVSHDVPQWGWSGRVYEGTSTSITVDQDISNTVIESVTDYDIRVIHNDDTIETFDLLYLETKGSNLLSNPSFETFTGTEDDATSDTFSNWTNYNVDDGNGNSVLAVTTAQAGSYAVKITNGNDPDATIVAYPTVEAGKPCRLTFYTRGDGSVDGRFYVYDDTNSTPIINTTSTGITGSTYTIYRAHFIVPAGCTQLAVRFFAPSSSGDAYYDNVELKYINTKKVYIDGTFSTTPSEDEKYIIGKTTSSIVPYRIQSVKIASDETLDVQALLHNASIYSDTGIVSSTREQSELPDPTKEPSVVTDLVLTEMFNKLGFIISFNPPVSDYSWGYGAVYISTDNDQFWKLPGGQYTGSDEQYTNVLPGVTYYIRVYSVAKNTGIKSTSYADSSITIRGLGLPTYTPSKLQIYQQGSDTIFKGKHCKVTWSTVLQYAGAGSQAPEVPVGDGAVDWAAIKDFRVEVWNGSSLVRTEYTTDNWYIYTFEKNKEDNITPLSSFTFKVYQRNYLNRISEIPATLTVKSDTPPPPKTINAYSEEGGVTFIWSEVTTSDFSHYEYRNRTEDGDWSSWQAVYTNSLTVWLTIAELQEQGMDQHNKEIQVRSVDVFGTASSSVTSLGTCNNTREYLVVSPTSGLGQYTTVASAVAALPSQGGTIMLKEGTHTLPSGGLALPDKDLIIAGVGVDTVKVHNVASDDGFVITDRSKKYTLREFTMESQNNSNFSKMINNHGTSNTSNTTIDKVKFVLKDDGTPSSTSGDTGIYIASGTGDNVKHIVTHCEASGGYIPVHMSNSNNAIISQNVIRNAQYMAIYARNYSGGAHIISENKIDGYENNAILAYTELQATALGPKVTGNDIKFQTGVYTALSNPNMVWVYGKRAIVTNNNISLINTNDTDEDSTHDIQVVYIGNSGDRATVSNNTIFADLDYNQKVYGIFVDNNASFVTTTNNNITLYNAETTATQFGIVTQGDYGVIGNNIIVLSNTATNIGIHLRSDSNNTYGVGNLVYGGTTAVLDEGSNNEVTATKI